MKTAIHILAHKAVQSTFARHFRHWEALVEKPDDITVWCPANARVDCPGIAIQAIGPAQHAGAEAIIRIVTILQHCRDVGGYDQVALFEYDSLCLGGKLPEFVEDFGANVFQEDYPGKQFTANFFTHPPLVIKVAALSRLCDAFTGMRFSDEAGYWDRWLGVALERSKLSIYNFRHHTKGFSLNTIHPEHEKDLRELVLGGATMIHGIKSQAALDCALRARQLAFYREELQKEGLL